MPDFKTTKAIDAQFATEIIPGVGTPHRVSQPLLRIHEGRVVLCAFASTYTAEEIRAGEIGRPRYWAVAEANNGAMIARFDCRETDFTDESFDAKYSMEFHPGQKYSLKYFDEAYSMLDDVRRETLRTGTVDREAYRRYFVMVLDSIPPAYRIFYRDLGSPDSL